MRLRQKGISNSKSGTAGDQLVRIKIELPENIDPTLEKIMEDWGRTTNITPVKNSE